MRLTQCATIAVKVIRMIIRTYSELITLPTFIERYRYLRLGGRVGEDTFGFDRYLNQTFYKSDAWREVRNEVIIRDTGLSDYCQDLGVPGYDIGERILIHHMNPITADDILNRSEYLLNPEYLICTCKRTHDAIHYGDESLLYQEPVVRYQYDTCPWKKQSRR